MMTAWAQKFTELLTRLGTARFSIALFSLILLVCLVGTSTADILLHGNVTVYDLLTPLLLTLLTAPWVLYFFLEMISQLDASRRHLFQLVEQLEQLREQDRVLNQSLKDKVEQLNFEIDERKKAEFARQDAIDRLSLEVVERKKTQESLGEQTALLRSFINSSPDMIYFRNEKGIFYGCNKAVEQVTGKKEQELIGLSPFEVYPNEVAMRAIETDKVLFENNQQVTYEQWLQYPDGRKALFEMRKVPFFSASGRRLGLLGFGRDITERKKAADALEKAAREKTQFIATLSHELRTPLNGIVGLARMLRDTQLTEEQRSYLNTIYVSAETLGNLFNDIIDLDKADRRRLTIVPDVQDLPAFIDDISNLAQLMAEQKGLAWRFEGPAQLPKHVLMDATRTRQILWNLIGNAVKFTDHGQVGLEVSLEAEGAGQVLARFAVTDTGIGIPQGELDKIFAMYYQVESGGKKHATGTGIGLAVSRNLALAMGGKLEVTSNPGRGSTFVLTLPLPLSEEEKAAETAHSCAKQSLDILLVEDIELNVTVAKALLEKLGHQVTVAMTGQAALEACQGHLFDLVLLDIQLPDMTGFEVACALREQPQFGELPIVALTANVIKDKDEYLENGMDDAISKPLSVASVTAIIEEFYGEPGTGLVQRSVDEDEDKLLDTELLGQFVEAVGAKVMLQSAGLFAQQMPEYLKVLESNLMAGDQQETCDMAHKIKGAAAAIGLKRIQQLANHAQHGDAPAWQENIQDWVDEIAENWESDLALLNDWLDSRS
ncbi:aerobic respiration two-component sensor histidine kinase ArcB [Gallaecimonas kandeliae]|uniref:aerobic respiration two-component sensor histidine kinase ArcB n=1 Tax=Gallaecimonas kandeliae TaxID=3029055 RepID=UPI00264778CC|nr:aerobic respiration two-component sensor histidine kinase ArcB [Gallaecimonas kandeliae]WKE64829.1 aerobic respiration two-component sensor histidine kinase ArcB [Gallaecimonas kandeliae]